jgi:pimeloyl-ACP methyl ester carboxylesterase
MYTSSQAGQTTSVNGMQMYYQVYGQGEPLLLLHGFTGIGQNWQPFIPALVQHYQLIIPDLRGHGRSTNPSSAWTFQQAASDVFALLDHLEIVRFKAIGKSGGGNTLLHMAAQQPARLAAMVLVSATPYFPEQARSFMGQFTIDALSEGEWQRLREWHVQGEEQIRALWAQGQGFKDSYDDMDFTPSSLSRIAAQTLIVHGDRDPLYPATIPLELYSAISDSYLWIIPNGGHVPIFGAMANCFIETVRTFLSGNWG